MFNDVFTALGDIFSNLVTNPYLCWIFYLSLLVFIIGIIFRVFHCFGACEPFPFLLFGIPSSKPEPFKFADKVFNNSDLKKVFYSILARDIQYFEVWYSPNKSDLKKFKKTALLSFKCLLIELFYFESDHESISAFYDSNSFDVVLFSTVLGEHSDLKYYHDLPDFFRTLVNDKEIIILLKEQIINEEK